MPLDDRLMQHAPGFIGKESAESERRDITEQQAQPVDQRRAVSLYGTDTDVTALRLYECTAHEDRTDQQEDGNLVLPIGRHFEKVSKEHTASENQTRRQKSQHRQHHDYAVHLGLQLDHLSQDPAGRWRWQFLPTFNFEAVTHCIFSASFMIRAQLSLFAEKSFHAVSRAIACHFLTEASDKSLALPPALT